MALRISEGNVNRVVRAKGAVEAISQGTIVKSRSGVTWGDFFLKPEGPTYLSDLGR